MPKQRTRGGDMLERSADSHSEIAAKVGVDKSLVTRWISGERKPSKAQIPKLRELYGIPDEAWGELAQAGARARARRKAASVPTESAPAPELPVDEVEDTYADESNNESLRRYIREGIRELKLDTKLSGTKRAEALKKLVDAQVALDRSTGANALSMSRIVAHAEFQRVVRLITAAISPYPEALDAATKALEAARG